MCPQCLRQRLVTQLSGSTRPPGAHAQVVLNKWAGLLGGDGVHQQLACPTAPGAHTGARGGHTPAQGFCSLAGVSRWTLDMVHRPPSRTGACQPIGVTHACVPPLPPGIPKLPLGEHLPANSILALAFWGSNTDTRSSLTTNATTSTLLVVRAEQGPGTALRALVPSPRPSLQTGRGGRGLCGTDGAGCRALGRPGRERGAWESTGPPQTPRVSLHPCSYHTGQATPHSPVLRAKSTARAQASDPRATHLCPLVNKVAHRMRFSF